MSEHAKAVFLSYAREDAGAARRIAEALRSAGLEVWFDEHELRGGDAWDAKIRGQIGSCALFLPVISAQTQGRAEGYFRREWKMADHRTEDMGRRRAYLVPVCIDDTKDGEADVPDSFLRVQWTRLPGALPTPQFVEQVKKLLVAPAASAGASLAVPSEASGEGRDNGRGRPQAAPRQKSPRWTIATVVAVTVGIATAVMVSRKSPPPPVVAAPEAKPDLQTGSPNMSAKASATAEALAKGDKSIAVLPFTNMSEEKDSAFFTDGIQEDILTNLALIRELRVVSRTSVMQYRGTTKTMRQLAQELGVTYILEGSVRRDGKKVRVTGQLIHAATDRHVWAQSYNRDLTDIFSIQAELATAIADELKAALSPGEKVRLGRPPTANLAAYETYLKAMDIFNRSQFALDELIKAEALLQTAVELDPKFTAAWAQLSSLNHHIYFRLLSRPAERPARLEKAQQAVEMVERLAPDEPETWLALAGHYAAGPDYSRAETYIRRAAEALPNNANAVMLLADMDARRGRFRAALARYQSAYETDRQSPTPRVQLVRFLWALRRYDEVEAILAEFPDPIQVASLRFYRAGVLDATDLLADKDPFLSGGDWTWVTGDAAGYLKQVDELRRQEGGRRFDSGTETRYMLGLLALGETGRARDNAAQTLAVNPRNALALAVAGRKEESLAQAELLVTQLSRNGVLPYSQQVVQKAQILMWNGEKEQAIAEIARLLQTPSVLNVHELRRSVAWRPLQGDPRFEALLNDPKNNQPLF